MYRIMIVDDDAISLAIGKAFLEDEYEVSVVHSGLQALGALGGKILPDLIILDVLMPGIGGMEVMKTVRLDERLRDIPVIFLTGEKSADVELEGYTSGASDFLQKPVNQHLLKLKIKKQFMLLDLKRENAELKKQLAILSTP